MHINIFIFINSQKLNKKFFFYVLELQPFEFHPTDSLARQHQSMQSRWKSEYFLKFLSLSLEKKTPFTHSSNEFLRVDAQKLSPQAEKNAPRKREQN